MKFAIRKVVFDDELNKHVHYYLDPMLTEKYGHPVWTRNAIHLQLLDAATLARSVRRYALKNVIVLKTQRPREHVINYMKAQYFEHHARPHGARLNNAYEGTAALTLRKVLFQPVKFLNYYV